VRVVVAIAGFSMALAACVLERYLERVLNAGSVAAVFED
jgi:hypothetical protein